MTAISSISSVTPSPVIANQSAPYAPPAAIAVKPTAAAPVFNSRQVEDPSAGGVLVTQYLSAAGTTISQVPSTAVLAYLRQGLTADGQPKPSPANAEVSATA